MPWIALLFAGSFALYAGTRKRLNIDPILGLFVETLLLLPATVGFFSWLAWSGQSLFFAAGALFVVLALFVGALMVVPLILFHASNRLLNMTMLSLLIYSNPTTQLLFGIWLLGEAFSVQDLLAFEPISLGIVLYFSARSRPVRLVMPTG